MGYFNDWPIKWRLILISVTTSLVGLFVAGVAFITMDQYEAKKNVLSELLVLAEVIANRSTATLIFDDPNLAIKNLSALKAQPGVVSACIYKKTGEIFVKHALKSSGIVTCPPQSPKIGYEFKDSELALIHPIMFERSQIGTLYLHSNLDKLIVRFNNYLVAVAIIIFLAVCTVFILFVLLQRQISNPITALAKTAAMVSGENDYSVRVQISGEGELRLLAIAFNKMLSTIEARDLALRTINEKLEVRVSERTAELVLANKELESFAYTVSHDLRAPLRAIDGFSQILLDDYHDLLDADGRKFLQSVKQGSRDMNGLIDGLLMLSRSIRGELHRDVLDLSTMARDIIAANRVEEPGRVVECEIMQDITAIGDSRLLKTMLENLLGNAWKYTRTTPEAKIVFATEVKDGETVYFIKDNGAGFDMAYADKLFQPFQRLHRAGEFAGTGIGLATVQRIVHRHSGRIWADSVVGKGATFFFTIFPQKRDILS